MQLKEFLRNIPVVGDFLTENAPVKEVKMREAWGATVDDDEDGWRRLTGDSQRDLSPLSHARMREIAVYLWESNLLANRLIELPLAYLLGEGVALKVDDEENQAALDAFWNHPINQMDIKIVKKVRELALYGEQCYPVFVNDANGAVQLGYLDPALIETVVVDPANPEQPIGVVTVRDKHGKARRYKVIVNGDETELFTPRTQEIRATFTDGDAFYFTINDLSNGRRGRSDLLAQADWIDGYDEFLFGELDRARLMRAFLWDVKLTGATPDQVKDRAKDISTPAPNSVRVHNDAEEWTAVTPGLQAGDNAETARLFRNHVLGGRTIPEHWYGGGGDVNRAVGAEMGEPTFKTFSMRQREIKHILESIGLFVLRQKALKATGKEPDMTDPATRQMFAVEAVFPEMTARDTSKYAAALQQAVAAASMAITDKLITRETGIKIINSIAGRLGIEIDADDELTKVDAAAARDAEADTFVAPPAATEDA